MISDANKEKDVVIRAKIALNGIVVIMFLTRCVHWWGDHPPRLTCLPSDEYTLYVRGLSTDQLVMEDAERVAMLNACNELKTMIEVYAHSTMKSMLEKAGMNLDPDLMRSYNDDWEQMVDRIACMSSSHGESHPWLEWPDLELVQVHTTSPTYFDKEKKAFIAQVCCKVEVDRVHGILLTVLQRHRRLYEQFRTSKSFREWEGEIMKQSSRVEH